MPRPGRYEYTTHAKRRLKGQAPGQASFSKPIEIDRDSTLMIYYDDADRTELKPRKGIPCRGRCSAARIQSEPGFAGAHDRRRVVARLQLAEDVRDVVAHRLQAEDEASGDLRVGLPLGDQVQDFALALGELGECVRGGTRAGA